MSHFSHKIENTSQPSFAFNVRTYFTRFVNEYTSFSYKNYNKLFLCSQIIITN